MSTIVPVAASKPAADRRALAARAVLIMIWTPGRPSKVCAISRVPSVLLDSTMITS